MSDDGLLREASDPTTSTARLKAILKADRDQQLATGRQTPRTRALWAAVLAHPNCHLPLLRASMRSHEMGTFLTDVIATWSNPTALAVLMAEPSPTYQSAALLALRRVAQSEGLSAIDLVGSLEQAVELVASYRVRAPQTREMAERMAQLFGLPWPDEDGEGREFDVDALRAKRASG